MSDYKHMTKAEARAWVALARAARRVQQLLEDRRFTGRKKPGRKKPGRKGVA